MTYPRVSTGSVPRILVHEYVTGGGWPEPKLPAGLADEALAIHQAVLADFRAWGMVHTTTTLDSRLRGVRLPADRVIPLQPEQHQRTLLDLAVQSDAALIIAPESDGVHGRILSSLEAAGVPLLGASATAVAIAADKWVSYHLLRQNAIPTPETWLLNGENARPTAETLSRSVVIKPRHGAGAEGVGLVDGPASLPQVLAHTPPNTGTHLLQTYVPGIHASVSLLSNGERAVPLSLNRQEIQIGEHFVYRGGQIPLEHPRQQQALALAQQAVSLVPGLRGYIGVDLILAPEGCTVIEINPRLTTSYVGLRRIVNLNLAQAIWQACQAGDLPNDVVLTGSVSFGKDGTHA